MKSIIWAGLLVVGVSGCATSAIPVGEAKDVPADRIFATAPLLEEGNARATFVRDVGLVGSGAYNHLYIDEKKVASLDPGEKVEFVLPSGTHLFTVKPTDPFGMASSHTIEQDLKPGKEYFYRIRTDLQINRPELVRFLNEAE